MTDSPRDVLVIPSSETAEPEIGLLLGMLEDARGRTWERVSGVTDDELDWSPGAGFNSIGAILYHLAAIEADWLYTEVLEQPFPAEAAALFPDDVRDDSGHLSPSRGEALNVHAARLETVRSFILAAFRGMDRAEFHRVRALPEYDVTPEWVLHHLMQHEAEHRGEIGMLRRLATRQSGGAAP